MEKYTFLFNIIPDYYDALRDIANSNIFSKPTADNPSFILHFWYWQFFVHLKVYNTLLSNKYFQGTNPNVLLSFR